MLIKIFIFLFIFLFNVRVYADLWWHEFWSKKEVSGLSWLELPVGARDIAMGNACVAVVQDPTANLLNPAGIIENDNWHASFSHTQHFMGIRQEFVGATMKHNSNAYGITFNGMFIDGMELRNEQQDSIGEFGAFNYLAGITYARNINAQLNVGVTLKTIYEKIYVYDLKGWSTDFGCCYSLFPQLKVAMVFNNVGPSIDSVKIPFAWRIGAGYQKDRLLLSIETSKFVYTGLLNNVGAEYKLNNFLALRVGYILDDKTENFTTGIGINFKNLHIDYAFKPYGIGLRPTHIFTITK
jgi:hypothetical protein